MVLNSKISIRLPEDEKEKFTQKCDKGSRPYQTVLREIISAFNDGRLKITPTKDQKTQMQEFYK